jgi:hypothetical protein
MSWVWLPAYPRVCGVSTLPARQVPVFSKPTLNTAEMARMVLFPSHASHTRRVRSGTTPLHAAGSRGISAAPHSTQVTQPACDAASIS